MLISGQNAHPQGRFRPIWTPFNVRGLLTFCSPNNTMIWEERWHPLREEWVIVAAHRQDRPWSGKTVQHEEDLLPDYVPDCYLCPGNQRVSGKVNGNYTQTFVFDNDHPSVSLNAPD